MIYTDRKPPAGRKLAPGNQPRKPQAADRFIGAADGEVKTSDGSELKPLDSCGKLRFIVVPDEVELATCPANEFDPRYELDDGIQPREPKKGESFLLLVGNTSNWDMGIVDATQGEIDSLVKYKLAGKRRYIVRLKKKTEQPKAKRAEQENEPKDHLGFSWLMLLGAIFCILWMVAKKLKNAPIANLEILPPKKVVGGTDQTIV